VYEIVMQDPDVYDPIIHQFAWFYIPKTRIFTSTTVRTSYLSQIYEEMKFASLAV